ncbi:MAG: hypothetical protein KDA58_01480 [Planctomycetaceae bacterium]|nr:hypothetical protein [Planctomycetaceae bacterium]
MTDYDEYIDDGEPLEEADPVEIVDDLVPIGQTEHVGQTTDSQRGRVFPCESCGADLEFHIGQQRLKCPYCGFEKEVELADDAAVREQDYHAMLDRLDQLRQRGHGESEEHQEVRCDSCGADVVFVGTLTSTTCPYCASPIQREHVHTATFRVPVDGVLPFLVDRKHAQQKIADWVQSRWFAPNRFKKEGAAGEFEGVYLPYWTFDTLTFNQYRGQRGINYRKTVGVGKNKRTVTRTRWYSVSGQFQHFFDDVLVVATDGLPDHFIRSLEPWPLQHCLPFTSQLLAGHFARTYEIGLEQGFGIGRELMDEALRQNVRRRIGGDKQRIDELRTRCDAITYKHLLLPLWMFVYRYGDKPFHVYVNGATGEVQGERPYSWVKILALVFTILALFGGVALLASAR